MSTVKLGFIGPSGNASRHMRDLSSLKDTSLVAVCNTAYEKAQKAAKIYNGHAYSDYNQMLEKQDLDAVYISVPLFAPGASERAVINAGLAMFVISAHGYQERYLDIIDRAKELLGNRRIGFFMGYWTGGMPGRWWREKAKSGGQVHEQTTHEIDLARDLFGEAKTVYAVDRRDLIPNTDYDIEQVSAVSI